jgi:hypothetical protein
LTVLQPEVNHLRSYSVEILIENGGKILAIVLPGTVIQAGDPVAIEFMDDGVAIGRRHSGDYARGLLESKEPTRTVGWQRARNHSLC